MLNRVFCQITISAIALILCTGGCTGETAPPVYPTVVEVVFPNGRPIPGARVTFRSAKDRTITAYGKADADGLCRLTTYEKGDGAVFGPHNVVVGAPTGTGDLDAAKVVRIAAKYANYSSSGLEFTVTTEEADNHFKIEVTSD